MKDSSVKGFTLVEILVVVSMVAMCAFFFTGLFIEKSEEKIAQREAATLMTVSAAAINYLQNSADNKWPNQDGSCSNMIQGVLLGVYMGDVGERISSANLTANCSSQNGFYPLLTLTRANLGSGDVANMVAALLPSATVSGTSVTAYVPRPRGNAYAQISQEVVGESDGVAYVDYPEGCGDPQIVAYPRLVCSNGNSLGGFRIRIEEDDPNNQWRVWLKARTDSNTSYSTVSRCEIDGVFEPIEFSVFRFCE